MSFQRLVSLVTILSLVDSTLREVAGELGVSPHDLRRELQ